MAQSMEQFWQALRELASPQTAMEKGALPLYSHVTIVTKYSIENGGSSPLAMCHHFNKGLHQVNS